ncbi:hypothetical protein VL15_38280 [Burkholderia cepacia]|uniref:EscT/YscT/HrcT family type III secretion system export apparatus protein n=1 Tax=Burkholderia cepacia TaxID=292 RepID=A0A0J5VWU7_BURCE|nr:type III secretion system export apparatus subunit SctT [Burkholderia cepacia]KML40111.1 hypothetical protein VL15_38280 [Burkholderia cepacia]
MLTYDILTWTGWLALGFVRISPVFYLLPFLNSDVLTGSVRNALIALVVIGLMPFHGDALPAVTGHIPFYSGLIVREFIVGILLGLMLGVPFWAFHALGCIIDNQRGATISSSMDPANGVETSELAGFLNVFSAAIYLQRDGLVLMMRTLADSYRIMPLTGEFHLALYPVLTLIGETVWNGAVLASPVLITLLLTETVLGLLSRFAPQLNAFSVSMTVKSLIAIFVMLLYFGPELPHRMMALAAPPSLARWITGG